MAKGEDFSHGSYGDYSGIVLYGPPVDGFWADRLAVSDRFIDPIFGAILARPSEDNSGARVPRLVHDWNALSGWRDSNGIIELSPRDAEQLIEALAALRELDLGPHCVGTSPGDCMRCVAAVQRFLAERLACGLSLFIERE